MVSKDYHGLYEDDYCYFTYYNNVTGEFEKDTWTTAGACPNFGNYECMWISEGVSVGLVDKSKLFGILFGRAKNEIENLTFDPSNLWYDNGDKIAPLYLKVTVNRGRKFKGSGYLVGFMKKSFQYAAPRFHNHFYGTKDFGVTTTTYAKIYVPDKNMFGYATAGFVEYDNINEIFNNYKNFLMSNLLACNPDNIEFKDCNIGRCCAINYKYISFVKYLIEFYNNRDNITISPTAMDEVEIAKQKKIADLRAKHMPGILEWVRTKTDKTTEDEINALAEHIFKKRYM
jgi:hypothetical protein